MEGENNERKSKNEKIKMKARNSKEKRREEGK